MITILMILVRIGCKTTCSLFVLFCNEFGESPWVWDCGDEVPFLLKNVGRKFADFLESPLLLYQTFFLLLVEVLDLWKFCGLIVDLWLRKLALALEFLSAHSDAVFLSVKVRVTHIGTVVVFHGHGDSALWNKIEISQNFESWLLALAKDEPKQ